MAKPYLDRQSLKFYARRLQSRIVVQADFLAPQLSSGQTVRYKATLYIDPKTRAVVSMNFMYSRDGSEYLAQHGGKHHDLRQFAYQIGDLFFASPAWAALRERDADPHYSVDEKGSVRVRTPTSILPEFFGKKDDEPEG